MQNMDFAKQRIHQNHSKVSYFSKQPTNMHIYKHLHIYINIIKCIYASILCCQQFFLSLKFYATRYALPSSTLFSHFAMISFALFLHSLFPSISLCVIAIYFQCFTYKVDFGAKCSNSSNAFVIAKC